MRIWLIHMGEMVQSDGPDVRLYRLGLLAEELDARGHEVVRWIPTFVHASKSQRFKCDTVTQVSDRHQIRHIYVKGYSRHLGVARMRFHFQVARRWERLQRDLPAADLIVTSMPTPEICSAARRIGKRRNIPFIVDIRDLWPDGFYLGAPRWAARCGRLLVLPIRLSIRRSLGAAEAITGVSRSYVEWGIHQAGRATRPGDKDFALAYSRPRAAANDVADAAAKWRRVISGNVCLCLFLGTLNRGFDLRNVIEAARQLSVSDPGRFEWIICGDGPTKVYLERVAADLPNVRFPGWIGGTDAVALLAMASVGLAPYTDRALQSLPNKPFEYAAAGIPVISSLGGELADLLRHHKFGTNYPSGDPTTLAQIVARYANDEHLRTAHGMAGRRLWESEQSPAIVYPLFAKHLEMIAANRTVGRLFVRTNAGRSIGRSS